MAEGTEELTVSEALKTIPIKIRIVKDLNEAETFFPKLKERSPFIHVPIPHWSNTFSPCDSSNKYMDGMQCCLGVIAAGRTPDGTEVSLAAHLDPVNMARSLLSRAQAHFYLSLPYMRMVAGIGEILARQGLVYALEKKVEESGRDMGDIFAQFKNVTTAGSRSVGIIGGFIGDVEGVERNFAHEYQTIVDKIAQHSHRSLGVDATVLSLPKDTIGMTNLYYLTSERLALIVQK